MINGILPLLIVVFFMLPNGIQGQSSIKVSVESVTETLQNGKLITIKAAHYFEFPGGLIITWNLSPERFMYVSNPFGEARIYDPVKNTVTYRKDPTFSSKNHSLYQFLTNQHYDLGLQELGFRATGSREENGLTITTWQAPSALMHQVNRIELVHEELLPVYAGYINTKGETTLKIYYSDFVSVAGTMVPSIVTEIIFMTPEDSTIRRSTYTHFRTGEAIPPEGFDLTIPSDAKVVH